MLHRAPDYSTDWLQLWSANRAIRNPFDLREIVERLDNELVLGPLTTLSKDETVASFARKFKIHPAQLFKLNPDLDRLAATLPAGSSLCVISDICSQPGDARLMTL